MACIEKLALGLEQDAGIEQLDWSLAGHRHAGIAQPRFGDIQRVGKGRHRLVPAVTTLDQFIESSDQLPALPADKVYQLWIVPQGAAAVSAGLLTPDANGHASLFFPMPADVTAPQALAVTVEPAGGVPAPTGSRVLLGTVPVATAS